MAKIDLTKFEGYNDMTLEEKLALLENFEYEDNAEELARYKNAVTKANSETASFKKKLNERLTEEERQKQEQNELIESMKNELSQLKQEKTLANNTSVLMGVGFTQELANESAQFFKDGNIEGFTQNLAKFIESHDKNFKAELMNRTPKPDEGGVQNKSVTKEQFEAMSYGDRLALYNENQDLYNELNGGN